MSITTEHTGARALTAREAAKIHHCTVAHVYNMATRDKWRKIRLHGRIYYHPKDVDKTLGHD